MPNFQFEFEELNPLNICYIYLQKKTDGPSLQLRSIILWIFNSASYNFYQQASIELQILYVKDRVIHVIDGVVMPK